MKFFKKYFLVSFLAIATLGLMTTTQSCKTKEGCPTDHYKAKTNKKGTFKAGKGKSNLFPGKMRKKIKKKEL